MFFLFDLIVVIQRDFAKHPAPKNPAPKFAKSLARDFGKNPAPKLAKSLTRD